MAGYPGALLAFAGFFLPACLITWATSRTWDYFKASPWRLAVQRGLAPIVVGLMAAGTIAVARTAIINTKTISIAAIVFIALYFGKKINPAILVISGGIVGFFILR